MAVLSHAARHAEPGRGCRSRATAASSERPPGRAAARREGRLPQRRQQCWLPRQRGASGRRLLEPTHAPPRAAPRAAVPAPAATAGPRRHSPSSSSRGHLQCVGPHQRLVLPRSPSNSGLRALQQRVLRWRVSAAGKANGPDI